MAAIVGTYAWVLLATVRLGLVSTPDTDSTALATMSHSLAGVHDATLVDTWTSDATALTPQAVTSVRNAMKSKNLDGAVVLLTGGYMLIGRDSIHGPWTVMSPLPKAFLVAVERLVPPPPPQEKTIRSSRNESSKISRQSSTSGNKNSVTTQKHERKSTSSSLDHKDVKEEPHGSWKLPLFLGAAGVAIISGLLVYQYYSYDDSVEVYVYH